MRSGGKPVTQEIQEVPVHPEKVETLLLYHINVVKEYLIEVL
jgi:hypothetical protein